jgi:hypothetical protein
MSAFEKAKQFFDNLEALQSNGQSAPDFIKKHSECDWGED